MAQNISLWGVTYNNVPALTVPKSTSGTAKFTDVSPTTISSDSEVASGKIYFKSDGTQSTGTNSGGGGTSMNVQIDNTTHRISSTTYVDTEATLTVSVAGTYDIYWSAFRSSTSSGTNGTQLYKNGNTQGSAYTSWTNSYAQIPKLSNVSLAKDDVLTVYARSSSNSRYVCVSNLTIIQKS